HDDGPLSSGVSAHDSPPRDPTAQGKAGAAPCARHRPTPDLSPALRGLQKKWIVVDRQQDARRLFERMVDDFLAALRPAAYVLMVGIDDHRRHENCQFRVAILRARRTEQRAQYRYRTQSRYAVDVVDSLARQ